MAAEVEIFDELGAVEADAAGALDREARASIYDRLSWFRLLQQHCPPDGKLVAIRARDGARQAWLFLASDGRKAQAYASWYSLRAGAIGDTADDVMTPLAAAVRDGGLSRIEIAPIEDPAPLQRAFRSAGWITDVGPAKANWRVSTEGLDFAAYWKSRPGKLRSTGERKTRSAGLEVRIHDRFDRSAWADYEAVYRVSWKPEEGSFAFLRALAEQEGAAGTLRLGIASKDGRPVAAQLWLVENGEATIHKLAYAEDAKSLSPGTVLGMAMFRHVIEKDRVRVIDYGTGDDGYKRDWMDERRMLMRLTAYNPRTLAGLIGAARLKASNLVARFRSR